MSEELTKVCHKCNRKLPATTEFFHIQKNGKYGLYSVCKKCKATKDLRRYKKDPKNHYKKEKKTKKQYYQLIKEEKNRLVKLHHYIRKIKNKPSFCTICNQPKRLELASINHTYTQNPDDYLWLCRSCHTLFDKLQEVTILVK